MKSTDTSPFPGGLESWLPGPSFAAVDLWRPFAVSPHSGGVKRWSKRASSQTQPSSLRRTEGASGVETSPLFFPVLQPAPARPQRGKSAGQKASRCRRFPIPQKAVQPLFIGSSRTAAAFALSRFGRQRSHTFPLSRPSDFCRSFVACNQQSTYLTDKCLPLEAEPVSKPLESVKESL